MRIGAVYLRTFDNWYYAKVDGVAKKLVRAVEGKDAAEVAKATLVVRLQLANANVDAKPVGLTMKVLAEHYMEAMKEKIEPKSMAEKRRYLNLFVAKFGNETSATLDTQEVREWVDGVERWNQGGRTACLREILAMLNYWSRKKKIGDIDLTTLATKTTLARKDDFVLSQANYTKIMNQSPEWLKDFWETMWRTGCRPSEMLRLTGAEYDERSACWDLKKHKTSHKGKRRTIALDAAMVDMTRRRRDRYGQGRLYPGPEGGVVTTSYLGERLKDICRDAGIPPEEYAYIVPYSFRHAFAVSSLEACVSLEHTAFLMGHGSTKVLQMHYAHADTLARKLHGQLDKLNEFRDQKKAN
jgi:integrase